MQGTLAVTDRGQLRECAWEAQRDKADFCGTWEWPCATGERAVKLRIERRDGHMAATYLDRDQRAPVSDFYDCGAGFYFTILIGHTGGEITITEDAGWLIGEGVLEQGRLKGRIEFYPYGEMGQVAGGNASKPIISEWAPRLIE